MTKFITLALVVLVSSVSLFATVTPKATVAVQLTKKGGDASKKNLDGAWTRAEGKFAAKNEKSGISGLVHLRAQYNFGTGPEFSVGSNIQLRQAFIKVPVSILDFKLGRWYDRYTVGGYYFGRYLHGVKSKGSGSMNTNYSIIDGFDVAFNIEPIKSALRLTFLPQDANFENDYLLIGFGGNPIEALKFNVATNINILTPASDTAENRLVVNASYTILKKQKLGIFAEYAIVDLANASDNMWTSFAITSKLGKVIDRIQAEFEFKKDRLGKNTDGNFAWMILIRKKVKAVKFDLNIGADPKTLGSTNPGDIGVIFRTSTGF